MQKNLALLKFLIKTKPPQRKAILCTASDDLVAAISEIALNTLKGNVPLKPRQISILKKTRKIIKKLSDKKLSLKRKKLIVKQTGGFIGPLLSFALPLLSSLLINR